jgi:hypothetical protein
VGSVFGLALVSSRRKGRAKMHGSHEKRVRVCCIGQEDGVDMGGVRWTSESKVERRDGR